MTKLKPLIGFEPMTYALPWRYSTTELKGLVCFNFQMNHYVSKMSFLHIFLHIFYIYNNIILSIYTKLIVISVFIRNEKFDFSSEYIGYTHSISIGKMKMIFEYGI